MAILRQENNQKTVLDKQKTVLNKQKTVTNKEKTFLNKQKTINKKLFWLNKRRFQNKTKKPLKLTSFLIFLQSFAESFGRLFPDEDFQIAQDLAVVHPVAAVAVVHLRAGNGTDSGLPHFLRGRRRRSRARRRTRGRRGSGRGRMGGGTAAG